jgi:hypothetical protein
MLSVTALQSASYKRSVQKESTLYICKLFAITELRKKVVFFILGYKVFPHNPAHQSPSSSINPGNGELCRQGGARRDASLLGSIK